VADKTILVALDGSELAERVLPFAATMARATGAKLHLVTVWEEGERALISSVPDVAESIFKSGEEHWERYLAGLAESLKASGVVVNTEVVLGDPATEILRLMETSAASLLVLATHGRSGVGRWRYGSVADKLAREAPIATFILGPEVLEKSEPTPAIRRILVPLNGSLAAESALRPALDLAEQLDAEVVVARALQWATQAMFYGVPDITIARVDEEFGKAAGSYLEKVRSWLKSDRVTDMPVLRGPPADALIGLVESQDIDLIVMTPHSKSGIQRALLGSVADRLLQAPAPVLLIRPEEAVTVSRAKRARYCHACGRASPYIELLPDDRCRRCGQHLRACANCVYFDSIACMIQRPELHDTYPGRECAYFQFRETPTPEEAMEPGRAGASSG